MLKLYIADVTRKVFFINLILLSSFVSFSQNNDSLTIKEWKFNVGYQNFRILDNNVSPLVYVANCGLLSFQFQKTKSKNLWNIGGDVSMGSNQSKRFGRRHAVVYDPYDITGNRDSVVYDINPGLSFTRASLFYSYYWKIKAEKAGMYVGGVLEDNFYYGALGADTWFFNQLSVMPAYRVVLFNKTKSRIEAEISTPLFSYLLRHPYTLDPSLPENSYFRAYLKTGSSFATVNEFQQVNLKLQYHHSIEGGREVGLVYDFMWMNSANIPDRNLKAYSNSLLISYTF